MGVIEEFRENCDIVALLQPEVCRADVLLSVHLRRHVNPWLPEVVHDGSTRCPIEVVVNFNILQVARISGECERVGDATLSCIADAMRLLFAHDRTSLYNRTRKRLKSVDNVLAAVHFILVNVIFMRICVILEIYGLGDVVFSEHIKELQRERARQSRIRVEEGYRRQRSWI